MLAVDQGPACERRREMQSRIVRNAAIATLLVALAGFADGGRYKKDCDRCVWGGADSGPNQCTAQVQGRFKKGANDSCVWDANDRGPDQCTPKTARWKEGGCRRVAERKDT